LYQLIQKYLKFVHLQERHLRQLPQQEMFGESLTDLVAATTETVLEAYNRLDDLKISLDESMAIAIGSQDCQQLIEELVDNAAKFSDAGTPIHLQIFAKDDQMHVVLQDQGRGMSTAELANIGAYQQFNREQFEQQGAGLGLAIAQLITQLYHGHLAIHSEINEGTTVHASFPHDFKNPTTSEPTD
ncbi:MAG: ATP-binding protein, partial [Limnothrix sp.]